MIAKIWTPDRQNYIGLAQLYHEHPDFKKFYAEYHPDLVSYLLDAIKIFAENNLK